MSEAAATQQKVSREGVILIKSFEGFRPRAVLNAAGRWTIGYGHTASAREGLVIGEQDAELLLQYDLLPVVRTLNERLAGPVNQHQFDALASFVLSVGVDRFLASDVLRALNAGHAAQAADALFGWPEAVGPDAPLRRRAAERALFVAEPGRAVALADLLAAPLSPPPVDTAPTPVEPVAPVAPVSSPALDARAAAVASLLGEPHPAQPAPAESTPAPEPDLEPFPAQVPIPNPFPPLPAEPPAAPAAPPQAAPSPDLAPFAAPPAASPFPPLEPQPVAPLELTPATDADFTREDRPVLPPEERPGPQAPEEAVLFEQEPQPPVLRHEVDPAPARRFDWSEGGAFLIMGATGLASCAFSAAAFRKAMVDGSSLDDFLVIGWVLALIGVICVGVSAWNLYVRWGRSD